MKEIDFYSRARVMIAPIFDEKKMKQKLYIIHFFSLACIFKCFFASFLRLFWVCFSYFSYEILAVISKHFNVRILA